ncbi:helix-turn-helix transcriptional regulator [Bradyrhizobium sp.]|uniref:helix-turn-helix transcriptional regulator n=1 Tax=Bradyrhizobium sp. TaxID=376 RepID=UPI003C6A40A6
MTQRENLIVDPPCSDWSESNRLAEDPQVARSSAVRAQAIDEAGVTIARRLNGPLTALLLYMGEIKQHSHQFGQSAGDRDYLQKVIENAMLQTERVCALVKEIGGASEAVSAPDGKGDGQGGPRRHRESERAPGVMVSSEASHKPLTRREREVLSLISEGFSNKQGAMRMKISPRTFESHRAEAMRKLGARNTAELVRAALLHPVDWRAMG